MLSSYRRRKFTQRFLAALAAFLFVLSSNFSIAPAAYSYPKPTGPIAHAANFIKPILKIPIHPIVPIIFTFGEPALDLITWGLEELQRNEAKEEATKNYCKANPDDPVCKDYVPGKYRAFISFYLDPAGSWSQCLFNTADVFMIQKNRYYSGAYEYWDLDIGDSSGYSRFFGSGLEVAQGLPKIHQVESCGASSPPSLPFDQWPQPKKDLAIDSLTDAQVGPILQKAPSKGPIKFGDKFPDGMWSSPSPGEPFKKIDPFEFKDPNLDTDGDGNPDQTDSDDDGDGNPDQTDSDDDGDGTPDTDELPDLKKKKDSDGDGNPDETDTDDDNDGNPDDTDLDDDGDGFVDDPPDIDSDGDGEPDSTDTDDDNDGEPDSTDTDDDGDGEPDDTDLDNDCKCCDLPSTGGSSESPEYSCPAVSFSDKNFVQHALAVSATKFPFDVIGTAPSSSSSYVCPTWVFFGQSHQFCEINNFLSGAKWIIWLLFTIKSVLAL